MDTRFSQDAMQGHKNTTGVVCAKSWQEVKVKLQLDVSTKLAIVSNPEELCLEKLRKCTAQSQVDNVYVYRE